MPFLHRKSLYKNGQDFLDMQYDFQDSERSPLAIAEANVKRERSQEKKLQESPPSPVPAVE